MPFGDSVLVSFNTKADLSKYGIYKIAAFGVDNMDDYLFNDTATINIENIKISETMGVFPNPFTDRLTVYINSPVSEKLKISITNESGIKLYDIEREVVNGNNSIILTDFKLLPSMYYLNIQGTSINKIFRIVKIKN